MPYKDKEQANKYRRERYATDPIFRAAIERRNKSWKSRNPEKGRAWSRRWQLEHPEQHRKNTREWKAENVARIKTYEKDYRKEHAEEINIKNARRRAREAGASTNDLTTKQWKAIKEHYNYQCVYCGKRPMRLTKDHIIPLAKGGTHTFTNIVPACSSCNSKKRDRGVLVPVQPLLIL